MRTGAETHPIDAVNSVKVGASVGWTNQLFLMRDLPDLRMYGGRSIEYGSRPASTATAVA
jgi:hypothetical protein